MGWHCCSKVPVLRETPNGQSLRDLNICSTCRRRGEVVEWHTMLQLLLRVSLKLWTLYPDSKQFQPCFSLKCSQCSSPSFYPYPLLLFYFTVFTVRKLPWQIQWTGLKKQQWHQNSSCIYTIEGWGFLDSTALSSETTQGRYSRAFKTLLQGNGFRVSFLPNTY